MGKLLIDRQGVSRSGERIALGMGIVVLLVTGLVSYHDVSEIRKDNRDAEQTRKILTSADKLLSSLKDAEIGQRGFLLTNRPPYLQPYQESVVNIRPRVDELASLTADRPQQSARVSAIRPLVEAKLAELEQTIRARQTAGADAALAIVLSDRGKQIMDQIRGIHTAIDATAEARLAAHTLATETRANRARVVGVAAGALLLLLLASATVVIGRATTLRQQMIAALHDTERETARAKDLLLTTLASIGDAVIATDAQGRITFLNPVAQTLTGWTQGQASGIQLGEVFRIVNEKTREPVESPAARVLREGVVVGLANHTVLLGRDGTEYPIDDSAAPIWDESSPDGQRVSAGVVLVFRDVTHRRAFENTLEQSRLESERGRELLRTTLASIGDAVIATDADASVTFMNPSAERLTGWTAQQAVGRPASEVFRIVDEVTEGEVENPLRAAIRQGATIGLENRTFLVARDGQHIAIDDSAAPIRDSGGNTAGAVLVFRDISARRRHERALEESETRFRSAFARAPIGMVVTDLEGNFVRANQAYGDIIGYPPEELHAVGFLSLTHPNEAADNRELFRRLLAGQIESYVVEKRVIRKTGEAVWVRASARILLNGEGQPSQVVGLVENIDSRKQAEAMLAAKARLAAVGADVGKYLTQVEDLREALSLCAGALVKHLGAVFARIWTLDSGGGTLELQASAGLYTHLDGPHSRIPAGLFKIGLIARERKPHLTNDVPNDQRVSDPGWAAENGIVAFAGYPLMVEERVVGVMAMFARHPLAADTLDTLGLVANSIAMAIERQRTESERTAALGRETEARLDAERSAAALSRANDDLRDFAHAASHDLRSPVRTVSTMTALLAQRCRAKLDEGDLQLIGFITAGIARMDSLISDLLTFSGASGAQSQPEPVSLEQAVQEAMENLRAGIAESHAVVTTSGLPTVMAHHTRLMQIFQNLIDNAIKYRSAAAPQINIVAERRGFEWLISVADNGLGFDPKFAKDVFGAFKRLHGMDLPGNGIGLATCKRIVESYGGEIWVEAEEGRGATFCFTLPQAPTEGGARASA